VSTRAGSGASAPAPHAASAPSPSDIVKSSVKSAPEVLSPSAAVAVEPVKAGEMPLALSPRAVDQAAPPTSAQRSVVGEARAKARPTRPASDVKPSGSAKTKAAAKLSDDEPSVKRPGTSDLKRPEL
jgi:hypothetical protein